MKCPVCGTVWFEEGILWDTCGWWQGMSGDWHNTELMDKLSPAYEPWDNEDDGEE